jgi:hypothetical protein
MTILSWQITTGFLDDSKQSRNIGKYAYRRGAANLMNYLDAERI